MAKIVLSSLVNSISGSLSGTTFRTNRAGTHFYPKTRNPKRNSQLQAEHRSRMTVVASYWRSLSSETKSMWKTFATLSKQNSTGYSAFMSTNLSILAACTSSLVCTTTPPTAPETPPPVVSLWTKEGGGTSTDICWTSPSSSNIFLKVYVTKVFGSSVDWRLLKTVQSDAGFYNHNYNYPSGTEVMYRARAILEDGTQGPYSYSPVRSLPIDVVFMGDVGNRRLKIVYLSDLSTAANVLGDMWQNFAFEFVYGVHCDGSSLYLSDMVQNKILKLDPRNFDILSSYDNSGKPVDQQLSFCKGLDSSGEHIFIIATFQDIFKMSKTDLSFVTSAKLANVSWPFSSDYAAICVCGNSIVCSYPGFEAGIDVFTEDLEFEASYDLSGVSFGEVVNPTGLVYIDGYLLIADYYNCKIVCYDFSTLEAIFEVTSIPGDEFESFQPQTICISGDYFLIVDDQHSRVIKVSIEDFSFVASYGSFGTGADQYQNIWGMSSWLK